MRSRRLWLCVPPAVLCLAAGGLTFRRWFLESFWFLAPEPLRYRELLPQGTALWGEPGQPLHTVFAWVLDDPFMTIGAVLLWISLFSLAVVVLPERLAKTLALALVFVHAAVVAFWLREWAQWLWVAPLLCLTAAALTVLCWRRASAADRGRSDAWLRRVAASLAAVPLLEVAAGLVLHVYGGYRFDRAVTEMEAFLGTKLSFDLARFERPLPPDADNAARWFQAGAAALAAPLEELRELGALPDLPLHEWPPETEAQLRELVGRSRRGLDLLHQAAGRERCSYGLRYRDGAAMEAPSILPSLRAASLLSVASRLALAQGDEAGGLRAARTLARLGDCLDEEPLMLFRLSATATGRKLSQLALEVAANPEPWAASPSLLSGLAVAVPAGDQPARWRETLLWEALSISHALRYGWRTHGWSAHPSAVTWFVFGPLAGAKALTESRQALEASRLPVVPQERCPPSSWMLGGWYFATCPREAGLEFVFKRRMAASQAQLARAALALRRLGLARGSYPRQRPELPDLTRKAPLTGRRIAYRLLADGSLRLEVEGAADLADLWKRLAGFTRRRDVFRVTLPPLTPPRGPGVETRLRHSTPGTGGI